MPRKQGDGPPPTVFPAQHDPTAELLADPLLDPATRLKDILRQVERAHDEWTTAEQACDELVEGSDKLKEAQDAVRTSYRRWHALTEEASEAESEVRRRSLEIPRSGEWQQTYLETVQNLKDQYDGLGPHYELLCENTAGLAIRLHMMEASGRDVSSGEYVEMHKLYLGYVNQLQKYTEAMKSESINKLTQEVAEQIIQLFERHFGNLYPEQWKAAVVELRGLVESNAA